MNDKFIIIDRWLIKAEHDLGTAKIIFLNAPEYYDTICFHCQQAVEKYIKAYLILLDTQFQTKHDLVYLLNLVETKEQIDDAFFKMAIKLQDFAVQIRYPDIIIELTKEDVQQAIEIADKFKDFVMQKIQSR